MRKLFFIPILLILLFSCASGPAPIRETDRPLYHGRGTASSAVEAMAEAKRDILRQVIPAMIGLPSAGANQDVLNSVYYSTPSPDMFLFPETIQTLQQGKSGDQYYYALSVRVNLDALSASLRNNDIIGNLVHPDGRKVMLTDQPMPDYSVPAAESAAVSESTASESAASESVQESAAEPELTPEEERFLADYLDKLTFMVTFAEESETLPEYRNAAVTMANSYLAERGLEVVDSGVVDQLKQEQKTAYSEQTGEAVEYLQWLAMNLNADVYIVIDGVISGETREKKHYGKVNITMKFFEASTGRLLSSQPYNSPQTFSTSSQKDAVINALQSSVYAAMDPAMLKVDGYMQKALRSGIKYSLILQNTQDSKMISTFRRKLKAKVKDVSTESQSAEETRFQVFYLGAVEDLQDLIFDLCENIEGMEGIDLVYMRGKSMTFDTGF